MAKTIDDIIEAKGSELYAMGCGQTYIGAYCDGIRFGANAVLEEIGKALDVSLDELSVLDGYKAAREKIKELKGE